MSLMYDMHRHVSATCTGFSFVFNIFLIYLIWWHTKSNIGTYKQLLTYLCMYNMLYSFLMGIGASPGLHSNGEAHYFVAFADGYFMHYFSKSARHYWACAICCVYGGALVLLKIHFIYRYVQICRPERIYMFDHLKWKFFWIGYHWTVIGIWAALNCRFMNVTPYKTRILAQTLPKEYRLDAEGLGYIGIFYRVDKDGKEVISWDDFTGLIGVMIVNVVSLSVMVVCGVLTYFKLNNCQMSEKTRKLQKQLFYSLVVLTLMPLAFVYQPELILLLGPIVGIGIQSLGSLMHIVLAGVPAIDPLILIYFIGDYRRAAMRIVLHRRRIGSGGVSAYTDNSSKGGTSVTNTTRATQSARSYTKQP